jgi:hypothetical protein
MKYPKLHDTTTHFPMYYHNIIIILIIAKYPIH